LTTRSARIERTNAHVHHQPPNLDLEPAIAHRHMNLRLLSMHILTQLWVVRYERPTSGTIAQMPRKPDQLRAQIKALEAHMRATKAEQRAASRPLREHRRNLQRRLYGLERTNTRVTERRAHWLSAWWINGDAQAAAHTHGNDWATNEALIASTTAAIADTIITLELFDIQHPELS
jgi:hypothetical protein